MAKPTQTKADRIRAYIEKHPKAKAADCIAALGNGVTVANFYDTRSRLAKKHGQNPAARKAQHDEEVPSIDIQTLLAENRRLKIAIQGLSATIASLL